MEGLLVLSTGQQTPGKSRFWKQTESLSFWKLSSNCGQFLRSWHFPGPFSAVVHADANSLSLFAISSTDCCFCCWTGACVEDTIVCLSGNATPRTKGAMLSVTLRPVKEVEQICIRKRM